MGVSDVESFVDCGTISEELEPAGSDPTLVLGSGTDCSVKSTCNIPVDIELDSE